MRLTRKENPETIKRYDHIKPARGWKMKVCAVSCPGTAHRCTLASGHRGPHVAHGSFKKVVAVWEPNGVSQTSPKAVRRVPEARATSRLRSRSPVGIVEAVWGRVVRAISSFPEIAFLILFLAFLGFAVNWLLLMMG